MTTTPTAPPARSPRPVMLAVLDGFGWREDAAGNAVRAARKPNFDRLWAGCPHAFLRADGRAVGLPAGQFGNSEVGHLTIGAGRTLVQDLPRIDDAVADGSLAASPVLAAFVAALRAAGGRCHLLGLVSDGGVHAMAAHGLALARAVAAAGIEVLVHAFADGRDSAPRDADRAIPAFAAALPPGARLATLCGRYYAMDRDGRWERVARAHDAIANGRGGRAASPEAPIRAAHAAGLTDEFVEPTVLSGYEGMRAGDGVLSFNYRADRVRELLAALLDPGFDAFPRPGFIRPSAAAGMTRYSDDLAGRMAALFPQRRPARLLGEVVADAGLRQLRMAETEKYPHVTYFMNGGREEPFAGEDRILVPSPKVATYDLQPEMSAPELTDRAVAAIAAGGHDLIVLNYANPDMVGHTGDLAAAVLAVEAVDAGLGRLAEAVAARGGALLVTADHGNCETMRDPVTGERHTAHTTNPVPALLLRPGAGPVPTLRDGTLADIAPTLLALLGLPVPDDMTGASLLG